MSHREARASHAQVLRRSRGAALAALLTLALTGCPRELAIPDASGLMCTDERDCNDGVTCGRLRACVVDRCETEATLLVPCDGGFPIDAPMSVDASTMDGGTDASSDRDAGL